MCGHPGPRVTTTVFTTDAGFVMIQLHLVVVPIALATTLTPRTAPVACAEVSHVDLCCCGFICCLVYM